MVESKLVKALRGKYKTPKEALAALGLDAALLSGLALDGRRARDEEGEQKLSAETANKWLRYLASCGVEPDEIAAMRKVLADYADGDLSEDEEAEIEEREATSGGMKLRDPDKEQKAMDARTRARIEREVQTRRRLATDSAGAKSFAERFPETTHIRVA